MERKPDNINPRKKQCLFLVLYSVLLVFVFCVITKTNSSTPAKSVGNKKTIKVMNKETLVASEALKNIEKSLVTVDNGNKQTGFIFSGEGDKVFIVTNAITSNANILKDGQSYPATFMGNDPETGASLYSVTGLEAGNEVSFETGKVIGEDVLAVGNTGSIYVVKGIISSDTEADIHFDQRNNGGVLINGEGKVLGMIREKDISFSKDLVPALKLLADIDTENLPYIGIIGKTVTEVSSKDLGLPYGVYVSEVEGESPAFNKLYAGDIINKMDGTEIKTIEEFKNILNRKKTGEKLVLTVKRLNRKGTYTDTEITLIVSSKGEKKDKAPANTETGSKTVTTASSETESAETAGTEETSTENVAQNTEEKDNKETATTEKEDQKKDSKKEKKKEKKKSKEKEKESTEAPKNTEAKETTESATEEEQSSTEEAKKWK